MAVKLNLGTSAGRAGSPLPAAFANPRVQVYHAGAHGAARPTCPNDAKSYYPLPLFHEMEEQRYLILECKVRVFKDVVHQDNEFAHDGSERNFGGFSGCAQPLIKLFELTV